MPKLFEIVPNPIKGTTVKGPDGLVWKIIDCDWSGFWALSLDAERDRTLSYYAEGYTLCNDKGEPENE